MFFLHGSRHCSRQLSITASSLEAPDMIVAGRSKFQRCPKAGPDYMCGLEGEVIVNDLPAMSDDSLVPGSWEQA